MHIDPIDNRIRELCDRLYTTKNDEELQRLATELQSAIHEHVEFVRLMSFKSARRTSRNPTTSTAVD
jgi:hypothetical protein